MTLTVGRAIARKHPVSKAANMDVLKLAREFDLPALEDQAFVASSVLWAWLYVEQSRC